MAFYESLRTALSRYEAGVHVAYPPALESELELAEKSFSPFPESYRSFLTSFNGVTLFHESVHMYSILSVESRIPQPGYLRVGEIPEGVLWMKTDGSIYCVDESEPDPILIAVEMEQLLDAVIAREGLLIDHQGEFLDVFDDEGNLLSSIRKKQAKASQKRSPHGAFFIYEQAELAWMERNESLALSLLQSAISCDPHAAPCYELLATLYEQQGLSSQAKDALSAAAEFSITPSLASSRWLKAGMLAPNDERARYANAALRTDPNCPLRLCTLIESSLHLPTEELSTLVQPLIFMTKHSTPSESMKLIREKCDRFQEKLRLRSKLQLLQQE